MLHGLIEARVPAMTANAMDVRFMGAPGTVGEVG